MNKIIKIIGIFLLAFGLKVFSAQQSAEELERRKAVEKQDRLNRLLLGSVQSNCAVTAEKLIRMGADINAKLHEGSLPVHLLRTSLYVGGTELTQVLLDANMNPEINGPGSSINYLLRNACGSTPTFQRTVCHTTLPKIQLLLHTKAHLCADNRGGPLETFLTHMMDLKADRNTQENFQSIVKFLIRRKVDISSLSDKVRRAFKEDVSYASLMDDAFRNNLCNRAMNHFHQARHACYTEDLESQQTPIKLAEFFDEHGMRHTMTKPIIDLIALHIFDTLHDPNQPVEYPGETEYGRLTMPEPSAKVESKKN